MVRAFDYGAMGRRIDPSWWTHLVISRCSQCSTTGVTKAVVCVILSVGRCIYDRDIKRQGEQEAEANYDKARGRLLTHVLSYLVTYLRTYLCITYLVHTYVHTYKQDVQIRRSVS